MGASASRWDLSRPPCIANATSTSKANLVPPALHSIPFQSFILHSKLHTLPILHKSNHSLLSAMPSEHPQSQSHRPSLSGHRSTSSIHSQTDSPSSTPPHHAKTKGQKHVVGGGRVHARASSSKSIHKLAKTSHANEGLSSDNLKKLARNSSATHLKKNHSHVSLKRNQSSSDVPRKSKTAHATTKRPSSVHFEIGDEPEVEPEHEDAWEEASSTASPALSRSASRPNSAKHSVNNSQPDTPSQSFKPQTLVAATTNLSTEKQSARYPAADAKVITERLLQRTPSYNTTKMSLATATPAKVTSSRPSDSLENSQKDGPNSNGTSQFGSKEEVVSRFVSGSGTPSESQFLKRKDSEPNGQEDMKRAQSMGNLTRRDSSEERALAPRSRKSSTSNAYVPPQLSRTQQKLWLQRASSNIEPQGMTPGAAINGLSNIHGITGAIPILGAGYDGRDPRIKQQLERTGLEYLVVRRHQDPIGLALKRLNQLPGADKNRRIPSQRKNEAGVGGRRSLGLSQSLKDARRNDNATAKSSYGSQGEASGRGEDDEGVSAILRSLWEKNFDFSSSAD